MTNQSAPKAMAMVKMAADGKSPKFSATTRLREESVKISMRVETKRTTQRKQECRKGSMKKTTRGKPLIRNPLILSPIC